MLKKTKKRQANKPQLPRVHEICATTFLFENQNQNTDYGFETLYLSLSSAYFLSSITYTYFKNTYKIRRKCI